MLKLVVLLCAVAMAAAKPSWGLGAVPLAYSSSVVHGSPFYPAAYPPLAYSSLLAPGVLAQPPHAPAVVLDAALGVPLDTPEVVAARAAHYHAKALSLHHLKKRSLAVSPLAYSHYPAPLISAYPSPLVSPYSPLFSPYSSPLVASPLAYRGVVPKALSVHPW